MCASRNDASGLGQKSLDECPCVMLICEPIQRRKSLWSQDRTQEEGHLEYIYQFLFAVTKKKIHNKHNVKEEGFIWTHSLRMSSSWWRNHGINMKQMITFCLQPRSREVNVGAQPSSAHFVLFLYCSWGGATNTQGGSSVMLLWKGSHRHSNLLLH